MKQDSETSMGLGSSNKSSSGIRLLATALLVLMICSLLLAELFLSQSLLKGFLVAFCEAAMVGALADWFAVTALFRHPLGIPIPHTAIIPSNKARIAKSLGGFIEKNFFNDKVLNDESINISGFVTSWLEDPSHRKSVIRRIKKIVPQLPEIFDSAEIKGFFDSQASDLVRRTNLAKLLSKILSLLTTNGLHEVVLDEVVKNSRNFVRSNQDWFTSQLRSASPWFIPSFIDKRIAEAIVAKTEETFSGVLQDRNHELRKRIHASVLEFVESLKTSSELQNVVESVKESLIDNEIFRGYLDSIRESLFQSLRDDVTSENSQIAVTLENLMVGFAATLKTSTELQHRINFGIRKILRSALDDQSGHVSALISRTVDRWDETTLVGKLEEEVSRDLQFIRINGTVVGGLIGVLLHGTRVLMQ